ncbi:MAG TPA: ornithine carbamoyltransferase [Chthoniobacteraceae bacterium]|nr:ornithine carbamoyltransferase [Chthoniobacteraceae bacterium]
MSLPGFPLLAMQHLLSIESLSSADLREILTLAGEMKATRGRHAEHPLRHQCWALLFSKSSTRTRVSFEVGIRELGGDVLFLSANDIQLGRGEPIQDTARVLGRMCHGAVIRTFAQSEVDDFARHSGIPTINALTDEEHPCQILADLFTIEERLGSFAGKVVTFIGDGACNVPLSWIWAAAKLDFTLRIAAPEQFQPAPAFLQKVRASSNARVEVTNDLEKAATGADVLYTDVWVSMGKEDEAAYRLAQLGRYQIDSALVAKAKPGALVMHCLPAYRGKEITEEVLEAHAATIFEQAENRLHAQKAVLSLVARRGSSH